MPTLIIHEGLFFLHLVASNSTTDYTAGICVVQTPTFSLQVCDPLIYKHAILEGQYGLNPSSLPKQIDLRLQNETFEGEIDDILSYLKDWIDDDPALSTEVSETSHADPGMTRVTVTDDAVYPGIVFDEGKDTAQVLEFDRLHPPGHVFHDPVKQTCAVVLFPNRLKMLKVKRADLCAPAWLNLLAGDD